MQEVEGSIPFGSTSDLLDTRFSVPVLACAAYAMGMRLTICVIDGAANGSGVSLHNRILNRERLAL
jgi:hypothetical protein